MGTSGKSAGNNLNFQLDDSAGTLQDITAYIKKVDGLPSKREFGDVTTGGASGHLRWPTITDGQITIGCVFDDAANSAWSIMKSFQADTATRSFIYGPAGSSSGYQKISGECWISEVSVPADVTKVTEFSAVLLVDGADTLGTF